MRHRVHQRLANGTPWQQVEVFANQRSVRFEPAETQEPADGTLNLIIETPGGLRDLQDIRCSIPARVCRTLDPQVPRLRIALRRLAERQGTVERRAQLAADLGHYATVAQVVLDARLRIFFRVESQTAQI